jgi:hypothetical protein
MRIAQTQLRIELTRGSAFLRPVGKLSDDVSAALSDDVSAVFLRQAGKPSPKGRG